MPKPESRAFSRIRAEVIHLVALIPVGKFTTYGTLAKCLNANPRHVASVLSRLDGEESADLPWHRVVAAEGRISQSMDAESRILQKILLESEGMKVNERGFIVDPDRSFHAVGPAGSIRRDKG